MSTPPNSASNWLPGEALAASLQILLMDAPRLPDGSPDTSKVNITGEALLARAQQLDERSSYEGVVDLIQQGVLVPRGTDGQQGTFRLNLTLHALTPEDRANLLRGQSFRLNSERLREYAANLPRRAPAQAQPSAARAGASAERPEDQRARPKGPRGPAGADTPSSSPRNQAGSGALRQPAPARAPVHPTAARIIDQDAAAYARYLAAQRTSSPPVPTQPPTAAAAAAIPAGHAPLRQGNFAGQPVPQPASIDRGAPSSVHQAALVAPPGAGTSRAPSPRNQQSASTAQPLPTRADSLPGSKRWAKLLKRG